MPDSSIVGFLANFGVLGIVFILWLTGLIFPKSTVDELREENRELKAALAAERTAVNESVAVGSVTNQLLRAFVTVANENRDGAGPQARPVKDVVQ